jgi:hypothetical protein
MRVLVACEFSGRVRDAFIARGHDAVSCDILPAERDGPHIQGDVLEVLDQGWDLMIAHPPCTYLSDAGIAHRDRPGRAELAELALQFFLRLYTAPIPKVAVENPRSSIINSRFRKPDQTVHPWYFGERQMKRTCLWLRGLPKLWWEMENNLFGAATATLRPEPTRIDNVTWRVKFRYATDSMRGGADRAHNRSRTFQAIADTFAQQWGGNVAT